MQLAALPGLSSSLTAPFHISTGYGPSKRDSVFPRPVQIVKWERQANIIESRRSNHKEERHYAQDRIDQAEKEAVAQNHSEQAETESTETEEDFNESKEAFKSAETHYSILINREAGTPIKMEDDDDVTQIVMKENDDAMQIVNKQIRVKDFALAHVINLEQPCKRQDLQSMVECIEVRGTNVSPAYLNIKIKLNDYDINHETKFVEVNEMQQLIRARALFTLDENNDEDTIKEVEDLDDVTRSLGGSNRGPDPGQTSKAKAAEAMKGRKFGYSGEEVSRYSLIGKLTTRTNKIYGADTKAEIMHEFNEIEGFEEPKIEEKYSEYGA